ncbi:hypothetical protein FJ930_23630 [Mesorhizobium sp. B2-4-15]|uniref:hypothetical protein n=1 Tax=Mesorhizobium sp. B2-4-15 TaxID=2589934 RepID=UPI00114ED7E8|nr:hypothetical protein [Mesorhizobium sp. B2-4-15]TPK66932.1 hypothetical protein FJ930_23630 [Mesorhizobium sp. B2-4-15]
MDDPLVMKLTDSARGGDCEAQEVSCIHRSADLTAKRFAALILEYQNSPASIADEFQRPRRPRTVEFAPQVVFMDKAIKALPGWMVGGGLDKQHSALFSALIRPPTTPKRALAVVPQSPGVDT